jgi:hypothetical protein
MISPERKAWILAELEEIMGPPARWRMRPRLVADGGRIVGDAEVIVPPDDPNWYRRLPFCTDGKIVVEAE